MAPKSSRHRQHGFIRYSHARRSGRHRPRDPEITIDSQRLREILESLEGLSGQ